MVFFSRGLVSVGATAKGTQHYALRTGLGHLSVLIKTQMFHHLPEPVLASCVRGKLRLYGGWRNVFSSALSAEQVMTPLLDREVLQLHGHVKTTILALPHDRRYHLEKYVAQDGIMYAWYIMASDGITICASHRMGIGLHEVLVPAYQPVVQWMNWHYVFRYC